MLIPDSAVFAQSAAGILITLRGVVTDPSGASVPGAALVVIGAGGDEHRAATDQAGTFEISVVTALPITIMSSARGFDTAAVTLDTVNAPLTIALAARRVQEQVTVSATLDAGRTVSTATKTPTSLLVVPQAVEAVDASTLRAQAALSMQDAMRNVAGVSASLGEGRRDQFLIRGFSAQYDTLIDGVRDDALYYRDLATIERIEVLKGPAAALFGRGSSGGVINRIVKTPQLEEPVADFSVTGGSLGVRRAMFDVGRHAASSRWAFRVVGAGENSSSFRDGFFLRRAVLAPSLLWSSGRTTVLTQVEHLRDERLPDRGIPSIRGGPADVRIGQNYGYPADDSIDSVVTVATSRIDHRLTDRVLVRNVFRAAAYDTTFSNTAPNGTRLVANAWFVQRQQYNVDQTQQNVFNQTELLAGATLARTTHALVVGVEFGRQARSQQRWNGTVADVALVNPVLTAPSYARAPATDNRFDGGTAGLYVQDQVGISRRWKALVGVRGDRYSQALDDYMAANNDLWRADVTWSPRAGVVFQPTRSTSLYTSVSRSFQPSGEGLSLAVNAAELKPESSRNVEAGAKAELFGGSATATAALFRLDRTDIKTTDPLDVTRLVLVGRQRTDGLELTFEGRPTTRLSARAAYAWLDAAVLRSNTVTSGVRIEGNRPGLVPRQAWNLWTSYRLGEGWSIAGGASATGDRFTTNDDLVLLPGFVRVDGALSYRRNIWEIAVNVRNVLNRRYYESAASDFQIAPGAPREVLLTLRVSPR